MFNEVLKNFIFFSNHLSKKLALQCEYEANLKFEMLICGQFIAKDLNLWSTLLFVCFEKLNYSDF